MNIFYSPSSGGFFDSSIHGARLMPDPEWVDDGEGGKPATMVPNPDCRIPADAVEITRERHAELLNGQATGLRIVADADGTPTLQAQPSERPADALARVVALARIERTPILSVLDGMQVSAVVAGDTAKAQAIEAVKVSLRDITSLDVSALATFESMRAAFKGRYAQIVRATPADVRSAFSSLTGV